MSDEKNNVQNNFLKFYDPSNWSSLTKFRTFNYDEYPINSSTASLLRSIESRFEKLDLLWRHLNAIKSDQPKEREILKRDGFVDPTYSKLMTAIFEAILNEFYSINDNLAKILANIFPNKSLPDSMSKIIKNVENYALPAQLSDIIRNYTSYQYLSNVRTESVHFSTGFIVNAPDDVVMYYFSDKAGPTTIKNNNAVLIDNVAKFYDTQHTETIFFVNCVFSYLESTLKNNHRSMKICGFHRTKRYMYQRKESYSDWKNGTEGLCMPIWEENNSFDKCPFIENCKAYNNHIMEKNKRED